ncbi:unnamed protein product [Timema podura]|uniref:Uncharacterized protein n=1 Tax=Timema podura TaxID=61482 RepID=A0ABN7P1F8_TIMPD|nr:unnamed protein product [Timema podura]
MEAFDHMLEAWISVLHNSQEFPKDFCKQSAMQIFNTYLKCHLSPPDGTRGQVSEVWVVVWYGTDHKLCEVKTVKCGTVIV